MISQMDCENPEIEKFEDNKFVMKCNSCAIGKRIINLTENLNRCAKIDIVLNCKSYLYINNVAEC